MKASKINKEYDKEIAKLLLNCCLLTNDQFKYKKWDGNIPHEYLKKYNLDDYVQSAKFSIPKVNIFKDAKITKKILNHFKTISDFKYNDANIENELSDEKFSIFFSDLEVINKFSKKLKKIYVGYALKPKNGIGKSIIALRGTKAFFEGIADFLVYQSSIRPFLTLNGKYKGAKVHFGFLFLYLYFQEQIKNAVLDFDIASPCYITGSSLGGCLAVLAAAMIGSGIRQDTSRDGMVQLYNFGSARVGNKEFKEAFDYFIPSAFRVVNIADVAPTGYPPAILPLKKEIYDYYHIGEQWSFKHQTGNILTNHLCKITYKNAIKNETPTKQKINKK